MTVRELRSKYLEFFKSKGHQEFPSGSLVPYDVTGRLDESLLFNGAGMVQFKPFFRGVATPPHPRLTNAQKCLRTGDIESVGDTSHLTFFEMLGNFSFGDYFKTEAIAYSWEFLTSPQWLALEPQRLSFTVFAEDDEAFEEWSKHVAAAGLDANSRIFRLGEETNYWPAGAFSSGPPGPCGPNTEMFYWVGPGEPPSGPYSREDWLRDEDKWLEIWNDVFIQYEWQGALRDPSRPDKGYEKTGMPPLPFRSVDTGMGLERTAAVLGGYKSVYDTDAFTPIIEAICNVGEGQGGGITYGQDPDKDRAIRIIADHLRSASFCIADGVLPANTGRGYVLRRLIRRAVLKGVRTLGFQELFLPRVFTGVLASLGDHYTQLHDGREVIVQTLANEEDQFRRTLEQGFEILDGMLARLPRGTDLPGPAAFRLYDTFGFPVEVTREIAEERGFGVDMEGYLVAMAEAQERSRAGSGMETVYGGVTVQISFSDHPTPTEFLGYTQTEAEAAIVGVLPAMEENGYWGGELVVALDRSPFYAESGGQVSDTGVIEVEGLTLRVADVHRQDGVIVHLVEPIEGLPKDPAAASAELGRLHGKPATARVDKERRAAITRNHTATHLLHAALRNTLGKHVTQAGSLVAPDHLRFDFTHGKALSPDEISEVERIVNDHAMAALGVRTYEDVPLDEARAMGAMALFGEKYAGRVRVVQIGDMEPSAPSFSRELCGGVHVRNTGEIGLFKLIGESSAAGGVRRITALTGTGALDWVRDQEATLERAASLLKSSPKELVASVEKTLETLREERKKRERLAMQGAAGGPEQVEQVGAVEWAVERLDGADPKDATLVADRLVDGKPARAALVAVTGDGKLFFVCKVGDGAKAAGAHAGNIVKAAAQASGGGGGGRPDFATAGGKDASKLDAALSAARSALAEMVGA